MNKKSVTVSAPGKLMLFGEHAVVHGKPCIVTAVNQRLKLKADFLEEPFFELDAKEVGVVNYQKPLKALGNGDIPKGARFVEIAFKNFIDYLVRHSGKQRLFQNQDFVSSLLDSGLRQNDGKKSYGLKIETVADFKSTFGFGSSSASTVCTIKALSELFDLQLSSTEIFDLSYKTVLDIQGVGSGFDVAAAIYGGTILFVSGGSVIEPLDISALPLIVGFTGIKADTTTLVKMVNSKLAANPKPINKLFDEIETIVSQAKAALLIKDFARVGNLMNLNQAKLVTLGVSSNELDNLISAAINSGAYGAKLSGAGGGDCMIALAPENKTAVVEQAIEKSGGTLIKVDVNAKGVRIEK